MIVTAKIFQNGASQAVRLPKEFRFEAEEVLIRRIGSAVLLVPKERAWDFFERALGAADPDFMADREQPTDAEQRDAL